MLAALWATLQFRFVALQYAVLAHVAENVLLVGVGPVATAFIAWSLLSSADATAAPFYALAVSIAAAAVYLPPLAPSFVTRARATAAAPSIGGGAGASAGATVQTRAQCAVLALTGVLQPAAVYAAVHARRITEADHVWALALLLSTAVLALNLVPRALWWLPRSARAARIGVAVLAFVVAVAALEQRVVLVAFGAYVKLPAPWSWLVVTAGLYLGAALAAAYFAGLVPLLDPGAVGVCCVAAAAAAGAAAGLPLHMLPFCLVAGAGALARMLSLRSV